MSTTERRRIGNQIGFNIYRRCLVGIGTELMRRNAKKVEEISVEKRIHSAFISFKGRIGNLISSQRQTVTSFVTCGDGIVTRREIIAERVGVLARVDVGVVIRSGVRNRGRAQQL